MKDYKTLTREKVDVEPGAARYMGETHMMEDWSDKMIDLVLNGPTLNGFKKDELRAMLRQTYAALKQYEQIGPVASPSYLPAAPTRSRRTSCAGCWPGSIAGRSRSSGAGCASRSARQQTRRCA